MTPRAVAAAVLALLLAACTGAETPDAEPPSGSTAPSEPGDATPAQPDERSEEPSEEPSSQARSRCRVDVSITVIGLPQPPQR